MWRQFIFKVTRKISYGTFPRQLLINAEQSKITGRQPKINILEKMVEVWIKYWKEVSVCVFGIGIVGDIVEKELTRTRREEHVILLGKTGSGIDLVCKSLLGSKYQDQYNGNGNLNESIGNTNDGKNDESSVSSSVIKDMRQSNPQPKFKRDIKITSICLDDVVSSNNLKSLSILQDYSVLFCFPVSDRFTTEDLNLLQRYLTYRQREDFEQVTIAFTYSERFTANQIDNKEDYLANLSGPLNEVLKKCGHKYMFFNSDIKKNDPNVKNLLKPLHHKEFHKDIVKSIILFFGIHVL